jgi:hypothetical protein
MVVGARWWAGCWGGIGQWLGRRAGSLNGASARSAVHALGAVLKRAAVVWSHWSGPLAPAPPVPGAQPRYSPAAHPHPCPAPTRARR